MSKSIDNIFDHFKIVNIRNNKRIVIFLISLLIATSLWFLNALSKDYSTTISYPVKFINPPENRFLAVKTPTKLELDIDGQGFTLLRFKLLGLAPLSLDINEITKNLESNSGNYRVMSQNLISKITGQLNSDIKITHINPEVLEIVLDSLVSKTVPVELDINADFEPQFDLKSPIETIPNEVKITGPATVLDNITVVKTKVNILNKLNSSIKQDIELIHPEKTTILPEKVSLIIDIEKYTEKELKIPIEVLNKPKNTRIKLFPSEAKVVFQIGLSKFENAKTSDFGASVDYDSIVKDVNSLSINLYKKPDFISGIRIVPEKVEFLIETNN